MLRKKIILSFLLIIVVGFLGQIELAAEPIIVNASQLVLIQPEERNQDTTTGPRILVKFNIPEELRGDTLRNVWLEFGVNLPIEGDDSTLVLRICPIATAWGEDDVSWSRPWILPGGDFIDSLGQTYFLKAGTRDSSRIELTEVYQRFSEGTLTNYGIIFVVENSTGRAYRLLRRIPWEFRSTLRLIIEQQ